MNGLPSPFRDTMFDIEHRPVEIDTIKPDYGVYVQSGDPIPFRCLDLYFKLKYEKNNPCNEGFLMSKIRLIYVGLYHLRC